MKTLIQLKNGHAEARVGVGSAKMKTRVYWHIVVVNLHALTSYSVEKIICSFLEGNPLHAY